MEPARTACSAFCAGNAGRPEKLLSLDDFLIQARRNTFSVSAMAFQDVWNLDPDVTNGELCVKVRSNPLIDDTTTS